MDSVPAAESDSALLLAWSRGRDEEAFRALARKYLGLVRGVALRRTGNPALAEEIAWAVFARLAAKAGRVTARATLAPWLHHCAWCETTDALRREASRRRHLSAYSEHVQTTAPADPAEPESGVIPPGLDDALRSLPREDLRLVLMRFYEGLGLRDIAVALGKTEAAVKKQSQRALERMERRLRRRGAGASAAALAACLTGALRQPSSASASSAAGISNAAARAAAGTSSSTLFQQLLTLGFMNAKVTAVLLTAVCMSAPLAWQWQRANALEERIQKAEAAAAGEAGGGTSGSGSRSETGSGQGGSRGGGPGRGVAGTGSGIGGAAGTSDGAAPGEDADWRKRLDGPERAATLTDKSREILAEKNPAKRLKMFALFMEELKPGDYDAVNKGFTSHDQEGRLFPREYELFLASAGETDGPGTLNSIFQWHHARGETPTGAEHTAMSSWAMEQPEKAIEWWNSQEEGVTKDEFAKSLISGLALKDIDLAWRCLSAFPEEERAPFMGSLVHQKISDQGADAAAAWLSSLQSADQSDVSPLKQRGFESLYNSLVNVAPDRKSAYVSRFAGEPWMAESRYPAEVAGQWAEKEGGQAADWAAGLPEAVRTGALVSAMERWSHSRPEDFAAWKTTHAADPAVVEAVRVQEELARARP